MRQCTVRARRHNRLERRLREPHLPKQRVDVSSDIELANNKSLKVLLRTTPPLLVNFVN